MEERIIYMTAIGTPRQKSGRFGNYTPIKYQNYKAILKKEISEAAFPKLDYSELEIIAYYSIPETYKKKFKEGDKMRVKPDWDNVGKAVSDALEKEGVIKNDSAFSDGTIRKRYTEYEPRIIIRLK